MVSVLNEDVANHDQKMAEILTGTNTFGQENEEYFHPRIPNLY